ncbi:MAG: cohesin domain-containing protein [Minisyncoccia bacterium]
MSNLFKKIIAVIMLCTYVCSFTVVFAEQILNVDASSLVARSEISITPQQASFTEGSVFEVPILINTKGRSINTIELNLKFDPTKLSIVKPSTGKSIIGLWIQPPTYDNVKGIASIAGSIPGGIVSESSLVLSVTFLAKSVGTTEVRIQYTTSVLANDGVGTPTLLSYNRAVYTILPKPPGGLTIYSDTHPFQDHWYNNNSPVLAWNKDPGIIGFSYVLDDKPNTIPDNKNLTTESTKAYQDLKDGLWYFHIKALKDGNAWGTTTNYIIRIDTTPPALFTPKVDYITSDSMNRALISFFTTDSLSGIDHYEVGVIDKSQSATSSPIFTRSESPYQVPPVSVVGSTVIVRAYDVAGNSVDTQVSLNIPGHITKWLTLNTTNILAIILLILVFSYIVHYLWGHHVIKKLKLIGKLLSSNDSNIVMSKDNIDPTRYIDPNK